MTRVCARDSENIVCEPCRPTAESERKRNDGYMTIKNTQRAKRGSVSMRMRTAERASERIRERKKEKKTIFCSSVENVQSELIRAKCQRLLKLVNRLFCFDVELTVQFLFSILRFFFSFLCTLSKTLFLSPSRRLVFSPICKRETTPLKIENCVQKDQYNGINSVLII